MDPHRGFGRRGIARLQGLEDRVMVVIDRGLAVGEREEAHTVELRLLLVDQLPGEAAAGPVRDEPVEHVVEPVEFAPVVGVLRLVLAGEIVGEPRDQRAVLALAGPADHRDLQRLADEAGIADFADRNLDDLGRALRLDPEIAGPGEPDEGLRTGCRDTPMRRAISASEIRMPGFSRSSRIARRRSR